MLVQRYRTFNWDPPCIIHREAVECSSIVNRHMHQQGIATTCDVARKATAAKRLQQWCPCVSSIVHFDAGRAAVTTRAEVKLEEVQLYQLQEDSSLCV